MTRRLYVIVLILLLSLGMFGCSTTRETPPLDVFEEYGNSIEIASTSIYIDQAYQMLNSFDIQNDYPSIGKEIVVVYLVRSQEDAMYYEIYCPVNPEYEIVIRETSIPDFSKIQSELNEYISLNSDYDIDVFESYSKIFFFPNTFDGNFDSYIYNLEELYSPIILEVGKIEMESSFPSICLAKYYDDRYTLFYYDILNDEIIIVSEWSV